MLDKEGANARKAIFLLDASKGFLKDGNKNRLREQDIHQIVDTFTRQAEVPRYSRLVPVSEIADPKNDYNLNLPRYIDSTEPEDCQDIDAHLRGGIPNRDLDALAAYWQVIPDVRAALFKKADRTGYSQLKLPIVEVKPAIFGHPEFTAFNDSITKLFAKWKKAAVPHLKGFAQDGHGPWPNWNHPPLHPQLGRRPWPHCHQRLCPSWLTRPHRQWCNGPLSN